MRVRVPPGPFLRDPIVEGTFQSSAGAGGDAALIGFKSFLIAVFEGRRISKKSDLDGVLTISKRPHFSRPFLFWRRRKSGNILSVPRFLLLPLLNS